MSAPSSKADAWSADRGITLDRFRWIRCADSERARRNIPAAKVFGTRKRMARKPFATVLQKRAWWISDCIKAGLFHI